MATGGYRSGGSTTDFLEEWKAKREKMRAKQNPAGSGSGGGDPAAKCPAGQPSPTAAATAGGSELSSNHGPAGAAAAAPAAPGPSALNCALGASASALPRSAPGSRRPEDECSTSAAAAGAPASRGGEEESDGAPEKGRSSGPSARKGKGQIEKRKLREKRRSTGVVNIPAAEVSRAVRGRVMTRSGFPRVCPSRAIRLFYLHFPGSVCKESTCKDTLTLAMPKAAPSVWSPAPLKQKKKKEKRKKKEEKHKTSPEARHPGTYVYLFLIKVAFKGIHKNVNQISRFLF
ncbi:Pawr [Phodopus roborovskii]|uniref:Pawr protein n=1 Tax=Phodopus roborovskii TaxID=109678 RepID=A0AAV0A8B3_PHORO|nr:Pawr [Phodopus roborovskii]